LISYVPAMAQEVVGEHAGHHGFADGHRANVDARIMAAFGRDLDLDAFGRDRMARPGKPPFPDPRRPAAQAGFARIRG
jgi:hypothetical protein